MAEPHDTATSARLDALRRGLYRPGSTEADLQRYLDERAAIVPDMPAEDAPPPVRRRRRLLVVGASAGLGLALVVALALAVGHRVPARVVAAATPAIAATTAPAPTPTGPPVVLDVGDGQTLTVPAGATTTSVASPTTVRGTAVIGRLFEGTGNAVLSFDSPAEPPSAGTAAVLIDSGSRVPVAWRALSPLRLGRAISGPTVLARGISAEPSNAAAPQTFHYRADSPPARIAVAAPPGTRWSLLIAVAREDPALH